MPTFFGAVSMAQSLSTFLARPEMWALALAFAAFLVLYWALRGSPVGQAAEDEGEDAPRGGYRDRVIAAVVLGLILVMAGAYVALNRSVPWSIPPFVVGFGILLTLNTVNQRHRHASPTLRRTVDVSSTLLNATLIAGILIVLNVLAFRYGGHALDFTRERTFSLSSLTTNQLASLKRPVAFTLFYGDSPRAQLESDRVRQLLELYKAAKPDSVRVDSINPYRDLQKFEDIMKRVPEVAVTQGGGVLVEYDEGDTASRVVVRNGDLFELPRSARVEDNTALFESSFHGEDALTSALIGLREEKRPKVAFTTGHGEASISGTDPRKSGIGVWKTALTAIGADAVEVNLLHDEIPDGTSLVIVVAPASPFKPDEAAKLKSFSERGGPLMILSGRQDPTGLEDLLKSFNIALGQGIVIDRALNWRGQAGLVFAPITPDTRHPIVDPLMGRATLIPMARAIHPPIVTTGIPANANVVVSPLLRTGKQSWSESALAERPVTFDKGKDELGPITVAVAVTDRAKPGEESSARPRLVFISADAFSDNTMLGLEPTNQDVLMNAIGWLRGRSDLQGIAPKTHVSLTLAADPVLRARLILVPTVMAVLLIIALGIATYVARRE